MASARIIAPELGLPGVLTKPPQHTLTKASSRRGKSSSSSRHGHRHRSSSSSHGSRHKSRQHRHRHRRSRSRGGRTARSGSTYNSSASTASSQLSDEGSTLGPHGGEGAPTHSAAYASVHPSVVESLYSLSSSVHGAHTRQARHIRRHRRHKHNQTIALSARNSIHRRSAPSLAASVQHSARLRRSSKKPPASPVQAAVHTVFRSTLKETSRTEERPLTALMEEGAPGQSREQLRPMSHCLGYTGHKPGELGLGQEVFTETNPVLDRMLAKLSRNLTSVTQPCPMAVGPVSWMSTTNKDIAKAGAQTTHFVNSATPRIIDHEHFRVDSEFTRFTDACLRQKLDPLNTGH